MRFNPFSMSTRSRNQTGQVEKRGITFDSLWGQGTRMGGQTSGPVSMEQALGVGAVLAATSLIADTIATFPLECFRKTGSITNPMDPPAALIANPTDFGTRIDWIHRCVMSMLMRGNAFGIIVARDAYGWPTQIEWLHPDDVSIKSDRTNARPQWYYLGRPVDLADFVHIPMNVLPGRVLGISPIRMYASQYHQSYYAQNFGVDYFKNGTVPAGMLTTDKLLQPGDADTLSQWWRKQSAGRGTPVVGQGLEYKQISIAPEESQFLATIRASATVIAAIYHLPPEMVGGDSSKSITYTNVDGWPITVARFALMPYLSRIELALSQYLPRPQSIKFDLDAFQRPDMAARYASYHLALTDGWMKVDEVRQNEDLPPLGGKDGGLLANRPGALALPGAGGAGSEGGTPQGTEALPDSQRPGGGNLQKGNPKPAVEANSTKPVGIQLSGFNGHRFTDPRELAVALREVSYEE